MRKESEQGLVTKNFGQFLIFELPISSVIWQKPESLKGSNKNTKHAKFSEKRTFLTP